MTIYIEWFQAAEDVEPLLGFLHVLGDMGCSIKFAGDVRSKKLEKG